MHLYVCAKCTQFLTYPSGHGLPAVSSYQLCMYALQCNDLINIVASVIVTQEIHYNVSLDVLQESITIRLFSIFILQIMIVNCSSLLGYLCYRSFSVD